MYEAQVQSLVGEPRSHMPHGTAKKKELVKVKEPGGIKGPHLNPICLLPVPRAIHHLLRELFLDDMTDHKDAEYSATEPRSLGTGHTGTGHTKPGAYPEAP